MKVKDKIKDIANKTSHRELAIVTSPSLERAKDFVAKIKSSLVEVQVLQSTKTTPMQKVENLKLGKVVSEENGTKRHKATCEVILSTKTETVFYVVVCQSNRDMRRRIEKAAGTSLEWNYVEAMRKLEDGPQEGTTDETGTTDEVQAL